MSNKNLDLLIKLIELKPEFEDEKGKGIKVLGTNIYVKNGVIILVFLFICIILMWDTQEVQKILAEIIDF